MGTTISRQARWHICYRNDKDAVRNIMLKHESDYDIVDELTNETFTEAWEHLNDWDERSSFLTWVCGIAKHVLGHHLEKVTAEKRANEVLEVYVDHDVDDEGYATPYYDRTDLSAEVADLTAALEPSLEVEAREAYGEALMQMPDLMASAVQLRAQGHSNPEIARILGTSRGYVENLISRAKNFFAECENSEVNRTNYVCERNGEPPLRERLSQSDVERAAQERFAGRDSALSKRRIRMENPDCSTAEWQEKYNA